MKEKNKKKGFIQIPLLIIAVTLIAVASVGVGVILHKQEKLIPLIANISQVSKGVEETITTEKEESNVEKIRPEQEQELERAKLEAETAVLKAEAEKVKAEAEKARRESEKLKSELEQINREEEQKQINKILLDDCLVKAKQTWDQRYLIIIQAEEDCKNRAFETLISNQWTPEECVKSDLCTGLLLDILPKADENCKKSKEENIQKWGAIFNQDKEDCYMKYSAE